MIQKREIIFFLSEEESEAQRGKATCPKSQTGSPALFRDSTLSPKNLLNSVVFLTGIPKTHVGLRSSLSLSLQENSSNYNV